MLSKSNLRIVHVVDFLMPAIGYQEFLLPKWNAIHGHETYILCSDRYASNPNYEQHWAPVLGPRLCGRGKKIVEGVIVERLKTWEFIRRPWLFGLSERVRQIDPDIVWIHGTSSPSAFRMALLCERIEKPLLMDNHQCFIAARGGLSGKIYYFLLQTMSRRLLANRVQSFIGVAQECCDFMIQRQKLPAGRVTLLPLGVDTNIFRRLPELKKKTRKELNLPDNALVVLQTGKLDHTRRPDWLAKAMAPLMREHQNLWLVYVGGISKFDLENLKVIFIKAGVEKRIIFHSFVPQKELVGLFNASDICVYPDSSSLSCFEAAACECVVILNDLPASRERADTGVGLSYRRGDVEHLQSLLRKLLNDSSQRVVLGRGARDYVLRHHSYDHIATIAEDLMREAITFYGK